MITSHGCGVCSEKGYISLLEPFPQSRVGGLLVNRQVSAVSKVVQPHKLEVLAEMKLTICLYLTGYEA